MAKINVLALGGLDEKQRRLYILEIDSKIFILDSGVYEPLNNDFGIQHFIPNMKYLEQNRDKIKAIFLSSANRMNIGSVTQIVEIQKNVEIYGSKSTIESLDVFFKGETNDWNKFVYNKGETKNISGIDVKAIAMPSIIPGCFGYVFKTQDGNVIYLSDYIFDSINEYGITPLDDISGIISEKNLLLISDVSKANVKMAISSKFRIKELIRKYFLKNKRLIVSIYEDEIINVIELIKLAKEYNKKIYFKSKTLFNLVKIMMNNGDLEKFEINLYEKYQEANSNSSVVILSGTRTKLYKTIELIIEAHNKEDFAFEKNDIVYMAALPQAGNEHVFARVINKITRIDPIVIKPNSQDKVLFGTSEFDIRNYITLLKPQHFMPVSSYFTQMAKAKEIAIMNSVDPKKIIIGDNGEKFSINNGVYQGITQKGIDVAATVIESTGEKTVDSELIEDRKKLGKNGVVSISFIYDVKKLLLTSDIDVQMKGVVIAKGQEKTLENVKKIIHTSVDELAEKKVHIGKGLPSIKKTINKLFREKFKKTPTLFFNIMEK